MTWDVPATNDWIEYEDKQAAYGHQFEKYQRQQEAITSAMPINSRNKGKRGELELAAFLQQHFGHPARRGRQFNGLDGRDVVWLDGLHVEVKRVEKLNLSSAIDQAERDAKQHEVGVVFHRKNREEWTVSYRARNLRKVYEQLKRLFEYEENDHGVD